MFILTYAIKIKRRMSAFLVVSTEIDCLVRQLAALRVASGPDYVSIPLGLSFDFELVAAGWSASPWGLMVVIVSAALLGGFKGFDFVTGRLTSSSVSLSSLIVSD